MRKEWDVFVYGDVNIDLVVPGVDALPPPGTEAEVPAMETFVGGGAALFALGVARLGLRVAFQGSVGRDLYGGYIRERFREAGVHDSLLSDSDSLQTGVSISFTGERDRCFLTCRGTNAGLSPLNIDFDALARARHIHLTGYEGPRNHAEYQEALRRIRGLGGVSVSFDLGWDMSGAWHEGLFELLPMIDVLFMNETECHHYTRLDDVEAGARRLAEGAGLAAVKLGSAGALAVRSGEAAFAPAYAVRAVDPTGAGDAFNAGFVCGWLEGLPLAECLRRGNGCGALSVTRLGGNTGFPGRDGLEAFIAEREREGRSEA